MIVWCQWTIHIWKSIIFSFMKYRNIAFYSILYYSIRFHVALIVNVIMNIIDYEQLNIALNLIIYRQFCFNRQTKFIPYSFYYYNRCRWTMSVRKAFYFITITNLNALFNSKKPPAQIFYSISCFCWVTHEIFLRYSIVMSLS